MWAAGTWLACHVPGSWEQAFTLRPPAGMADRPRALPLPCPSSGPSGTPHQLSRWPWALGTQLPRQRCGRPPCSRESSPQTGRPGRVAARRGCRGHLSTCWCLLSLCPFPSASCSFCSSPVPSSCWGGPPRSNTCPEVNHLTRPLP